MGVEPAATDFVATRFRDVTDAEACEQRTDNHHRTPQPLRTAAVVVAQQIVEVDVFRRESVGIVREPLDLDAHCAQQVDELFDVENLRDVAYHDPFGREQRRANHLQRLVFSTLRGYLSRKAVSALHFEYSHTLQKLF